MLGLSQPGHLLASLLLWLAVPSAALPTDQFGLAASVLPGSRSGTIGSPVTVYATIANSSSADASGCRIELVTAIAADFSYQTTDPATNIPTGTPDTPVNIAADGGSQSFIIVITPRGEIVPTDVEFRFVCAGYFPADIRTGLNTLFLSASSVPVPDIFARARTLNNEGIVDMPTAGMATGVFSIATTNAGTVGGDFLVFGYPSSSFADLRIFVCESDPGTGLCLTPPADSVTITLPAGANRTFSAFVQATGDIDPFFRPSYDRVVVAFLDIDASLIRSQTSVGVRFVPPSLPLAAVLPTSRSVRIGNTATAFASIVNVSSVDASGCSITPLTGVPAGFSYQITDPATNIPAGTPDTPVDIAAGALRTFVFSFTPTMPFAPTDIQMSFDCTNSGAAPIASGLDTFLLSASATSVPDVVAVAVTATDDGVAFIPGPAATGSFMVSAANIGLTDVITVSSDTGSTSLPVDLTVCEWDTVTQACLAPPATSVMTTLASGAPPTAFAVFLGATGDILPEPATNRILVHFKDSMGVPRGGTSVAVTTSNDNFANARVLAGPSGTVMATNVGATFEPGEPANAGFSGRKSLWWQWTATASASLTVDTFGSNFDTTLGVYTGSRVDALAAVASNDDANGTAQSSVTFDTISGTTYYISVDSFSGRTGSIVLNWGP